ncbi:YciI family protein [Amycolatopsis ultiminotia]|uniref:YciI family protein n=1 Tax=Amycolatopsis ultiminotia TaxID=543629 RepID=A0ABP6YCZ8_9PSEU
MKFLPTTTVSPQVREGLTEEPRQSVMTGHADFIAKIRASGDMISTQALGGPGDSAVARVRDGVPFVEPKEFGRHFVECENRTLEVAAMIPDAAIEGLGVEVRPVVFFADADSGTELG